MSGPVDITDLFLMILNTFLHFWDYQFTFAGITMSIETFFLCCVLLVLVCYILKALSGSDIIKMFFMFGPK